MPRIRRTGAALGLLLALAGAPLLQRGRALAAPSAPPQLVLVHRTPQGAEEHVALPPGQGLERLTLDGRVLRSRAVDPHAPLRLIVELDAEPVVVARLRHLDAVRPLRQAAQLRADLAVLAAVASPGAVTITREYTQVFAGAAVTIPSEFYERLRALPEVRRIFADDTVRASLEQSVPLIGADHVRAALGGDGRGVRVGILDTGIDYHHPAFGGGFGPGNRVAGGWDFVNGDADPLDDYGHGTHVAGIVGGNGGGVVGVAPAVTFYAFKVLDADGSGYTSWILDALDRVLDPDGNPATGDAMDVVNLSFGAYGGSPDDPMSLALDHLTAAGVVCVVAAGNIPGFGMIGTPASSRRAITVGASDKLDQPAGFSSEGPAYGSLDIKPDVMAPGVDIVSAAMGGGRVSLSGTSMAAPHVAGVAAQLRQLHRDWTPDLIKAAVCEGAKDLGLPVLQQGAGRVDAWAAAGAGLAVTPTQIAFGRIDASTSLSSAAETLHVSNFTAAPRLVTLPDLSLVPGAFVRMTPSSVTVPAGGSADVEARLVVDNAVVPYPPAYPYAFTGTLRVVSGSEVRRIPVSFHKAARLTVDAVGPVGWLVVHDRRHGGVLTGGTSVPSSFLLPPGTYDVVASFYPYFRFVVRENVVVSGDDRVTLAPSEATVRLGFADVGPDGAPVTVDRGDISLFHRDVGLAFNYGGFRFDEIWTSPMSPAYATEWSRSALLGPRARQFVPGTRLGATASQTVTNRPEDLHHFTLEFPAPAVPRACLFAIWWMPLRFDEGYFGFGSADPGTEDLEGPVTLDEWVQPAPYEEHLMAAESFEMWGWKDGNPDWNRPELLGPALRTDKGWPFEVRSFWPLGPLQFRFGGERLRLFAGVPVWRGRFWNSSASMTLDAGPELLAPHLLADAFGAIRLEPEGAYSLSRYGVALPDSSLTGSGSLFITPPITRPLVPGPHEFRTFVPYTLAGHDGGLQVAALFDSRFADPDPPRLATLQIFADGEPTDSIDFARAQDAGVRFRMDASLPAQAWVRAGDRGAWIPLAVAPDGDEWLARFPPALQGPVSLHIASSDASGNSLTLEWAPAFVALPGRAPAVTLLGANAAPGATSVMWEVGTAAGRVVLVQRREAGGAWSLLGQTAVGGDGHATYHDATAQGGHTYEYRLGFALGGTPQFSAETRVEVPLAAALELSFAGVRPNPLAGTSLLVEFDLPGAEPATLALFDLAGRRLLAREVGAMGAGRHLVRIARPGGTPPGVYFLRLTTASRTAGARVCLLD